MSRFITVWHHDSPGVKVVVKRNWLQRLLFPKNFSSIFEKHIHIANLLPSRGIHFFKNYAKGKIKNDYAIDRWVWVYDGSVPSDVLKLYGKFTENGDRIDLWEWFDVYENKIKEEVYVR